MRSKIALLLFLVFSIIFHESVMAQAPQCKVDFTFVQNPCNPKSIDFKSAVPGSSYKWSFGDGTNATSSSPSKSYSAYGLFSVKLIVLTNSGCIDSITKQIPVLAQKDNSLIVNNDTAVCSGSSVQLQATNGGLSYCWSPARRTD